MTDNGLGTIGFIGTGSITASIVRGLISGSPAPEKIVLSPRNADIAARLANEFDAVEIANSNQQVIDRADTVFLAVRPQIAEEVISQLDFRAGQLVVSIIAATERALLLDWIGADVELVQAIPLPFVEDREGVTAVYPDDGRVVELFNLLGTAVPCTTRNEYDLLAAASATMALYFGQMGRLVDWLAARGLPEKSARAYLSAHFGSLAKVAEAKSDKSLHALAGEYSTKGGLNEQVWVDFDERGGTQALYEAMDRVFSRITT